MNKKLVRAIAGGLLTVTTVVGANKLTQEIEILNSSITQIKQENKNKDEEIKSLKEELGLKENELKDRKSDINALEEERKVLYNEIEKFKKNINNSKKSYSNSKVSFNQSNLRSKSGVDANRLNKVLEGTGLAGLGSVYVDAENTYGVNAIFLTALTAQESGWGNSNRARTQNNLSGYAVYSNGSAGKSFSSKGASIYATAKLLANDYLSTSGKYHKGSDIFAVNTTYCPVDGYDWANKITSIAHDLVQEINSL